MTWYVHRRADGSIASKHRDHMEGYNDEALADDDPAILAYDAATAPLPPPKRISLDDVVGRLKAKNVFTQADVDAVTK